MTDPTAPTPAPPAAQPTDPATPPEPPKDDTDWKAEARKHEARAKEYKASADALTKSQRATMTEAERQVAEAKTAGRTEAVTEFGKRLARTEFDALAGRRNADFDTAKALKYVDLSSLLSEDGEPDSKAIKAAVEDLVPAPKDGPPDYDGGARSTAPASTGMNDLIRRKAAGRA